VSDTAYVLSSLFIDAKGNIFSKNVGVTFSLHLAEDHKSQDVANDFESFSVNADWREDAETTALVNAMRNLRSMVEEMQEASLR
jgi:hypothetical protein